MPNTRSALPLSLGLGLLLGLGLGQLLGDPALDTQEPSSLLPGGSVAAADRQGELAPRTDEVGLLRAELQRLQAELASRSSGQRTAVAPDELAPLLDAEGRPVLPLTTAEGVLAQLLDEFASKTYRDTQQATAERDGTMTVAMGLFYTYRHAGELHEALRLMQLIQQSGLETEDWRVADWDIGNLAEAFRAAGDEATATRLYLEALRRSPGNWEWARQLASLDPAGGLAVLREQAALDGIDPSENRHSMARLLAGSGDLAGALELLREGGQPLDASGWDLFMEFDPEGAERALTAAARGDDPYGELGLRLARHLMDAERPEEAKAELERLLALNPGNPEMVELLAGLDPARGLELYAAEVALHPDMPSSWTRYAELLTQAGRSEEALEANLRAFELSNGSWIPEDLLQQIPDRVLPVFQERADRSTDDELWGDLGDAYWRAGRQDQARVAWERARGLDSDDGEWINKLDQIDQGIDPFGNVVTSTAGFLPDMGYWGNDIEIFDSTMQLGY